MYLGLIVDSPSELRACLIDPLSGSEALSRVEGLFLHGFDGVGVRNVQAFLAVHFQNKSVDICQPLKVGFGFDIFFDHRDSVGTARGSRSCRLMKLEILDDGRFEKLADG